MTKRLFQVLLFAASLFVTAQVSAQSFPSVAPPPGTTTYNSLPALPTSFQFGPDFYFYSYNADGTVLQSFTRNGSTFSRTLAAGESMLAIPQILTAPTAPALPSGYSYTPTGQILTPSGTTVDSFSVGGPSVPFDGGMSLVLLASGIGYASKRMKAKKATAATV